MDDGCGGMYEKSIFENGGKALKCDVFITFLLLNRARSILRLLTTRARGRLKCLLPAVALARKDAQEKKVAVF